MLNNKIILGIVLALSISLVIGSSHHVYAAPEIKCKDNSHLGGAGASPICVCNDGFVPQEGSDPIAPICIPNPVGGMGIPIDSTALLLAGVQGSALWMIPALVIVGAGIGMASFKRSKKKRD